MTIPDKRSEKKPFRRLPCNVRPLNYDFHLKPDPDKLSFVGEQKVYVDVIEATETVLLNAVELNVTSAIYRDELGKEIKSQSIDLQPEDEILTITFPEKLPVGKLGHLEMSFTGKIGQGVSKGVFLSRNTSPESKVKHNIFTKFEPTYARRCIPCWDEPALKATFDVSLTVPKHLTALSNMPARIPKPVDDTTHTVSFERSPMMSTYLLAFAIGEFDYVEDRTSDGTLVRVYAGKGRQNAGRFALEVAVKVLPFYRDYFDIPYPLPKMDLVALEDFGSSGMENWGLVTFKDTCLLFNPETTPTQRKQYSAMVVAHEIAHMWFGDLVTMEWFTHLWLNEGYAKFLEYFSINDIFPEFDIWTQFINGSYLLALELDSLKNTHAIEVPVSHPSEIPEIFDAISYHKGSSILRMLHSYIGDADFRRGMHAYLEKYSYSNAQTEDLWIALEEASGKPVGKVMTTWTKREGFPLVKIEELNSPNADSGRRVFKLTQTRFIADGSPDPEGTLWHIPVKIISAADPKKIIYDEIFSEREKIIELEDVPQDAWIKVNPDSIAFFRTMYSKDMFDKLGQGILAKSLNPIDRLGIINDLYALSRSGAVKVDQVLRLMLTFREEKDYTVWTSILSCLGKINLLVSHLEIRKDMKAFCRHLLQVIYEKLGWDAKPEEGHLNAMLRPLVIEWLIAVEDSIVINEAKKRFNAHIAKEAIIPVDLREAVYRAVISQGGGDVFDQIRAMYRDSNSNDEKDTLVRVLGYSKDWEKIREILRFSISEESRATDAMVLMVSVTHSYEGRLVAWEFFKENFPTYLKRCPNVFIFPGVVKQVTGNFATEDKAREIEEFFRKNPTPSVDRSLQQSLEKIKLNEFCLKENIDTITNFLQNEEMAWNRHNY